MPAQDILAISVDEPELGVYKTGFVVGNDVQWVRTISGLIAGDTLINAWFTIKSSPAASDASGVQCPIGLVSTGYGQVVGAVCTFNMGSQQTLVLSAGPLYYYDIKVQTTPGGRVYTIEQGFIQFLPEVGTLPTPGTVSTFSVVPPAILTGANPPPAGSFAVGTRYWVTPPVEGYPAEWVYCSDLAWHVSAVVSN